MSAILPPFLHPRHPQPTTVGSAAAGTLAHDRIALSREAPPAPAASGAPAATLGTLDGASRALLILLATHPSPRVEQAYRALCELKAELLGTTPETVAARDGYGLAPVAAE